MAFGNRGHGIPGIDQAADQGDALCGEPGVAVVEHLTQHMAGGGPCCLSVADGLMRFGARCAVKIRLRFRFRFRHEGWIITVAHEWAVGGVTLC